MEAALQRAVGKRIQRVKLVDRGSGEQLPDCSATELVITFGAGKLVVTDEGQSCCEHRYMSTDDDLKYFKGAVLLDVQLREGSSGGSGEDCDDTLFLDVRTDKGVFTVVNHNEHNEWYGGFCIEARWEPRNRLA